MNKDQIKLGQANRFTAQNKPLKNILKEKIALVDFNQNVPQINTGTGGDHALDAKTDIAIQTTPDTDDTSQLSRTTNSDQSSNILNPSTVRTSEGRPKREIRKPIKLNL